MDTGFCRAFIIVWMASSFAIQEERRASPFSAANPATLETFKRPALDEQLK
jgi:hypothetical protein